MATTYSFRRDIIGLIILAWLTLMIIGYCAYKSKYGKPCTGHNAVHNMKTGQVTVMDKDGNIICIYFEPIKIKPAE